MSMCIAGELAMERSKLIPFFLICLLVNFMLHCRWYHQLRSYGRNLAINIWWVPVRKFDETDCLVEKDGKKIRKPLEDYASLSLYGFSPGEHHRYASLTVFRKKTTLYASKWSFVHTLV